MITKKILLIPLAFSLSLTGCSLIPSLINGVLSSSSSSSESIEIEEGYYLSVKPLQDQSICPDLPKAKRYKEGTLISFKILHVTDVTFYPCLDDQELDYIRDDDIVGGYAYYEFEMPNHDAYLEIRSIGSDCC